MYYPLNKAKDLVFSEQFDTTTTVGRNGGIIYGTPTIDKKYESTGNPNAIQYNIVNIGTEHTMSASIIYSGTSVIALGGETSTQYSFGYIGGKLYYNTGLSYVSFNYSIALGTEYKIHFSRKDLEVTLYVDGVKVGTANLNGGNNDFIFEYLGKQTGGLYFSGTLKDVEISNRCYTEQEVLDDYNNKVFDYTPVLDIPFKDKIGDTTPFTTSDITNNEIDATLNSNAPSKIRVYNGYEIDSTTETIKIPYSEKLKLGNNGTIEIWFNFDKLLSGQHSVVTYGLDSEYSNGFLIEQNGSDIKIYWGGSSSVISGSVLTAGLKHIVLSNSNGSLSLYIDGQLVATGTSSGTITAEYDMYIGDSVGDAPFGIAKKLKVFDKGITYTQVKDLFYKGSQHLN